MFADRHPGKVWSLSRGMPVVVCGSGALRILEARETDGAAVAFKSFVFGWSRNVWPGGDD